MSDKKSLDLDQIKARLAMATPGPWEVLHPDSDQDFDGPYPKWRGVIHGAPGSDAVIVERCGGEGYTDRILNADFIAHARTDIPALVEEVERLRGALKSISLQRCHYENFVPDSRCPVNDGRCDPCLARHALGEGP